MNRVTLVVLILIFFLAKPSGRVAAVDEVFVAVSSFDSADTNPGDGMCKANVGGLLTCTLRAAVQEANALPGHQTIQIPSTLTFVLSNGELPITEFVTIEGTTNGTQQSTISANDVSRHFHVSSGPLTLRNLKLTGGSADYGAGIHVTPGQWLTLDNVHIRESNASEQGGAIYASSSSRVWLYSSTIAINTAGRGGGIFMGDLSYLTVFDSQILGNKAESGGGVAAHGNAYFEDSSIAANQVCATPPYALCFGAGVYFSVNGAFPQLHLRNTSILDNVIANDWAASHSFDSNGGALYADGGKVMIENGYIFRNSSPDLGGAIYAKTVDSITISETTIDQNTATTGGGVYLKDIHLTVIDSSTISGNSAVNGAGLFVDLADTARDGLAIVNSTLSGNSADYSGGAIYHERGYISLHNATIADNRANAAHGGGPGGGGVFVNNTNNAEFSLTNTVIAGNADLAPLMQRRASGQIGDTRTPDCYGNFSSGGFNLIGSVGVAVGADCTFSGNTGNDVAGFNGFALAAGLGTLQHNGGQTFTHMPQAGSALINKGNVAGCQNHYSTLLVRDQIGQDRHANGRCDIGAFESNSVPLAVNVRDWTVAENERPNFPLFVAIILTISTLTRLFQAKAKGPLPD